MPGLKHFTPKVGNHDGGSYENVPDGLYTIESWEVAPKYLEDGEPFFGLDKDNHFVITLLSTTTENTQGPAAYLNPAEFYALAFTMGADFNKIRPSTKTMRSADKIKAALEGAKKAITVKSRNGFMQKYDLHIPSGTYMLKLNRICRLDRSEGFNWYLTKNGGESLVAECEIVGDAEGKPLVWKGFQLSAFLNNAFLTEQENEDGEMLEASNETGPLFKYNFRNDPPTYTTASKEWWALYEMFLKEEIAEYEWKTAEESEFGVNEAAEPQHVFATLLNAKDNLTFVVPVDENGKFKFDDANKLASRVSWEEEEENVLQPFMDYLDGIAPEMYTLTNGLFDFTAEGKKWAGETLNAAWDEQMPDDHNMNKLHQHQVAHLLENLKALQAF